MPGAALAFALLVLFYNPLPRQNVQAATGPLNIQVETPTPLETQVVKQNNKERHNSN